MLIVVLVSLLAASILEYIIPFSRNTKGVENASKSYYLAYAGIEEALFAMRGQDAGYETATSLLASAPEGSAFQLTARGASLPPAGEGNSEFDTNWNRIRIGEPIQLSLGDNMLHNAFEDFKIYIKVPDIDDNALAGSPYTLS